MVAEAKLCALPTARVPTSLDDLATEAVPPLAAEAVLPITTWIDHPPCSCFTHIPEFGGGALFEGAFEDDFQGGGNFGAGAGGCERPGGHGARGGGGVGGVDDAMIEAHNESSGRNSRADKAAEGGGAE